MVKCVVLVGDTLSGKSTIRKHLKKNFRDFTVISTGDIARSMEEYQEQLKRGELAPEDLMRERISFKMDHQDMVLIDSVRGVDQLAWLWGKADEMLILHLNCPFYDVLIRSDNDDRKKRNDDNKVAILTKHERFNRELGEEYVFACEHNIAWYMFDSGNDHPKNELKNQTALIVGGWLKRLEMRENNEDSKN